MPVYNRRNVSGITFRIIPEYRMPFRGHRYVGSQKRGQIIVARENPSQVRRLPAEALARFIWPIDDCGRDAPNATSAGTKVRRATSNGH